MNARERILTSLNHKQPDRVPVDFSGQRSSGISGVAYARLRDFLKLQSKPIRIFDFIQQLAIVDDDVLDLFGVDTIELGRAFATEDRFWHDWTLPDGTPCQIPIWITPERLNERWVVASPKSGRIIAQMPEGAYFFDQTYFPLEDGHLPGSELPDVMAECMWSAIQTPPGPLAADPAEKKKLIEKAKEFRQRTDRAIIGMFGSSLLERGQQLFRHDNFYVLLASDPQKVHKILDQLTEFYLEKLEDFLGAFGPYIDIIQFGDDLGMQSGPQISPRMYREFFKPLHQRMFRRAKELADVKVMLHSCGSVKAFLPDLIDAGVDAINPVQISAAGMDAAELKREFGDRLVFWGGGCDTQRILSTGTEEEIRQHVEQQISILAPGGGFVFQQVHNIQADTPPENIVAMFDAVRRYFYL